MNKRSSAAEPLTFFRFFGRHRWDRSDLGDLSSSVLADRSAPEEDEPLRVYLLDRFNEDRAFIGRVWRAFLCEKVRR